MAEIREPDVPLDPLCYLFRDGDKELTTQTSLSRAWLPFFCGAIPAGGILLNNAARKRPPYASLHWTVGFFIGGLLGGIWLQNWKYRVQGERDLLIWHYMTLHPEDFPPPERVKFRDVLKEWIPIR